MCARSRFRCYLTTVCCWVDLCILVLFIAREFSWFYWSLTCSWLLMFEILWESECAVRCMHWCEYIFDLISSAIPMDSLSFVDVKMYRHKQQHTWTVTAGMLMENLSCKVKPTQFVYRFVKLVCYESRHFSSAHFLLLFQFFFFYYLDRHIFFYKADIFISPINDSIYYLSCLYSERIFSHIEF